MRSEAYQDQDFAAHKANDVSTCLMELLHDGMIYNSLYLALIYQKSLIFHCHEFVNGEVWTN